MKLVKGKTKYADWTNRQDIRDELYSDVAVLLNNNGYPPTVIDEAYDEVLNQVGIFKKYEEWGVCECQKSGDLGLF